MPHRILHYIDPDGLAILLRKHGISAYTENEEGRTVVYTTAPLARINRILRDVKWTAISKWQYV